MDKQSMEAVQMHNAAYLNPSALQMRLETDDALAKIETFLSGSKTYTLQDEQTGEIKLVKKPYGEKLMNKEGVAHVVNYVSCVINPHVVQGNYDDEWYRQQLELTHKRIAFMLTVNTPVWGVKREARYSIIGFIMELVKPFLSRLIDNKERESYAATIKSVESSTIQGNQGIAQTIGMK